MGPVCLLSQGRFEFEELQVGARPTETRSARVSVYYTTAGASRAPPNLSRPPPPRRRGARTTTSACWTASADWRKRGLSATPRHPVVRSRRRSRVQNNDPTGPETSAAQRATDAVVSIGKMGGCRRPPKKVKSEFFKINLTRASAGLRGSTVDRNRRRSGRPPPPKEYN